MRSLYSYVFEHFSDNLFWKLDKWFEQNEPEYKEFIEVLVAYAQHKILTPQQMKEFIKDMELSQHLESFVNFIYDDKDNQTPKDTIKAFKDIIQFVSSNKGIDNRFIEYIRA